METEAASQGIKRKHPHSEKMEICDSHLSLSSRSPQMSSSFITSLFLSHLNLRDDNLCGILKHSPHVRWLDISNNSITHHSCQSISKLPQLHTLNLGGNFRLGDIGLSHLTASSTLCSLSLWRCGLTDQSAVSLARLSDNITELDMCSNKLGPASMQALSSVINLRKLSISDNPLGLEAVRYLSLSATILSLVVSFCDLDINAAHALRSIKSLTSLNIEGNPIGSDGVTILSKSRTMVHINVRQTNSNWTSLSKLAESLTLTHIVCSQKDIPLRGQSILRHAVYLNKKREQTKRSEFLTGVMVIAMARRRYHYEIEKKAGEHAVNCAHSRKKKGTDIDQRSASRESERSHEMHLFDLPAEMLEEILVYASSDLSLMEYERRSAVAFLLTHITSIEKEIRRGRGLKITTVTAALAQMQSDTSSETGFPFLVTPSLTSPAPSSCSSLLPARTLASMSVRYDLFHRPFVTSTSFSALFPPKEVAWKHEHV